ncbi:hypothetical protein C8J56DRAFT_1082534 [Mycena floridula]|nr:hypothetical protein C8J56DRAFT_1082534 [Mycena floridula]
MTLFRDARAGSIDALKQLGRQAATNDRTLRLLLPIIYGHLSKPPPENSQLCLTQEGLFALVPFFDTIRASLASLQLALASTSQIIVSSRQSIPENWDCIFQWSLFIVVSVLEHDVVFVDEADTVELRSAVTAVVRKVQTLFIPCKSTSDSQDRSLLSFPGYDKLLTRLWLYFAGRSAKPGRDQNTALVLLTPLWAIQNHVSKPKHPAFAETILQVPNAMSTVLDCIMLDSDKQSRLDGRELPLASSVFFVVVTTFDFEKQSPAMRLLFHKFIALGSISVITKFISLLNSRSLERRNNIIDIFYACGMYLHRSFHQLGAACIAESLRMRLLPTIYNCLSSSKHEDQLGIAKARIPYQGVLRSIIISSVNLQVLKEARKWFSSLEQVDLEMMRQEQPELVDFWNALHIYLGNNLRLRHVHKKAVSKALCGFSQCPQDNGVLVMDMKRCRGCLKTFYCSQACQKAHWIANHHVECHEGPSPKYNSRRMEPHFCTFILGYDFRMHGLGREAETSEPLIYQLDSCVYPPERKVSRLAEFLERDDLQPWDHFVVQTLASWDRDDSNDIVLYGIFPVDFNRRIPAIMTARTYPLQNKFLLLSSRILQSETAYYKTFTTA